MIVERIAPELAARALAGAEALDPTGVMRPGDVQAMCDRGHCYLIGDHAARSVLVIRQRGPVLWVDALAGRQAFDAADALLQREAKARGCASIAWQTARRSLTRATARLGYSVTGYTCTKDLRQ